jgi:inner membrane transporter RhtA
MTTTGLPTAVPDAAATGPDSRRDTRRGVVLMLTAGTSSQTGAAVGAHAFDALGPAGVVAVRQVVAASVLLPTVRPPLTRFTRAQWWPVLLLGLAFGGMNLSLYTAVDRLGLGLAVTLEFLGPLAIALVGSRRLLDLGCALAAALGVYVLVLPSASTDVLGVAAGLGAAACWAAYILLNRLVGQRLPGLQATATAAGVSALAYLPVAALVLLGGSVGWQPVALAAVAGLLSSVVPFALDLTALRLVPTRTFGVFMSAHPVLAALAGLLLLGQTLAVHEVVGIGVVVATNVVAIATLTRPGTPGSA